MTTVWTNRSAADVELSRPYWSMALGLLYNQHSPGDALIKGMILGGIGLGDGYHLEAIMLDSITTAHLHILAKLHIAVQTRGPVLERRTRLNGIFVCNCALGTVEGSATSIFDATYLKERRDTIEALAAGLRRNAEHERQWSEAICRFLDICGRTHPRSEQ